MAIRLLGPLEVDGAAELSPRDRVVLSALALHPGTVLSGPRLADALWAGDPPRSWPKIVQGCVVRLRRALGGGAIETRAGGYRLTLGSDEVDVHRFEQLVDKGFSLAARGEHERAAAALTQGLGLWRGPALPDLERWPVGTAEAARLEELRLSAEDALVAARLAEGSDVTADATALVHAQPLREHRWSLLARALYRTGRQAEALAALRQARRVLREDLGVDPGTELTGTEEAILHHDPALAPAPALPVAARTCPYKGLLSYEAGDAEWFHGRGHDVAECLRVLHATSLLAVVGASGSGKSSLVRAGLVPALQAAGRRVAVTTPGPHPESALAAAAGAVPMGGALVVDQLEELFAVPGAVPASSFLDRLAELAEGGTGVVLVLRADHVDALAASPRLARLVEQGLHLLAPMTRDQLRAAIEGPAEQAGLRLEAGLVELLLRDVQGEPGALPLLSHALLQTWERREGRVLTVEGYEATGGIRGAVAQSAETVYGALTPGQRVVLRTVLLRLVAASHDGDVVPTRVPAESLLATPQHRQVVDLLVRARLATSDDRGVVVAHEAVVRAWPRLRSWLDEDVSGGRALRHLILAAEDWQARGRPDSELYRGGRLRWVLEWQRRERPELTDREVAFLDASAELAEAEEVSAASRLAQQRRQNRRLRSAVAGTAAGLVLALVLGLVAVQRGRDAQQAAATAWVERLVAQSTALRDTQRDLAALLAVEAHRLRPDVSARSALFGTFTAAPGFLGYRHLSPATGAVPLADGVVLADGETLLAVGTDGVARTVELTGDGPATEYPRPRLVTQGARVAVDAQQAVVAVVAWQGTTSRGGRSTLAVYDRRSKERVLPEVQMAMDAGAVALSPDGRFVAVSGDRARRVLLIDLRAFAPDSAVPAIGTGRDVPGVRVLPSTDAASVPSRATGIMVDTAGIRHSGGLAFRGDGALVAGSIGGGLSVFDPVSGAVLDEFTGAPDLTSNLRVLLDADGQVLVSTGSAGVVRWDPATRRPAWVATLPDGGCDAAAVALLLGAVLCGDRHGGVTSLDLASGDRRPLRLDMQRGQVSAMAVSPDGRTLVQLSGSQPVLASWHLDGAGLMARTLPIAGTPAGYSRDGRLLLVAQPATEQQTPRWTVVDAGSGTVVRRLEGLFTPVWTRHPRRLVAWGREGTGYVIDVLDGRRLVRLNGGFGAPPHSATVATDADVLLALDSQFEGGTSKTWDLRTGQHAGPGSNRVGTIGSISADGRLASIVRPSEMVLTIRELATGVRVAERHDVVNAAVSPTSAVAVSTRDGRLVFYELPSLQVAEGELPGTTGKAEQIAFSDDGKRLVVRTADGRVRVVDVARRQHLGGPIALPAGSDAVALRPDGLELAVPSETGIVVWSLEEPRWPAAACAVAGRDLSPQEWRRHLPAQRYRETCPASVRSDPEDAGTPPP